MVESAKATSNGDELRFGQLACTKLVRHFQGAMSVGLPALVTGVPDPRPFLHDQLRVVTAIATVLQTVTWPVGNVQAVLQLREKSAILLIALENFQRHMFAAIDSLEPSCSRLKPAQLAASDLFDSIAEYANLIQLDGALIVNATATVMQLFGAMENFDTAWKMTEQQARRKQDDGWIRAGGG
jgi:hypothetical protein